MEGLNAELPTKLSRRIECRQGAVRAVRFNVDGNYCLTCGADKSVKLWNPFTGVALKTYGGMGSEVLDAQGSCDNSSILAGGLDKHLTLLEVETGRITRRWRDHNGAINSVAFNEESTVAISGSQDGYVRCFDVRDKSKPMQILDEATDAVLCVDVSAHEIVCGSADGNFRIYDIREGKMTVDFLGESVTSAHFSGDGQCVLASTKNGIVRLMDKISGKLLADYTGHKNTEYRVESCLLASDAHVVSGSEDGNVFVWNLIEMSILRQLEHPRASVVHSLCAHPKRCGTLLSASGTGVFVWEPEEIQSEE